MVLIFIFFRRFNFFSVTIYLFTSLFVRVLYLAERQLFCLNNAIVIFVPLMFVCAEVLRPSQPSGIMSSAVSLPYHTFTGQA